MVSKGLAKKTEQSTLIGCTAAYYNTKELSVAEVTVGRVTGATAGVDKPSKPNKFRSVISNFREDMNAEMGKTDFMDNTKKPERFALDRSKLCGMVYTGDVEEDSSVVLRILLPHPANAKSVECDYLVARESCIQGRQITSYKQLVENLASDSPLSTATETFDALCTKEKTQDSVTDLLLQSVGHQVNLGMPAEAEYSSKSEDELIRLMHATISQDEDTNLSTLREKFDTAKQQLVQEYSQATLPVAESVADKLDKYTEAFGQIAAEFNIAQKNSQRSEAARQAKRRKLCQALDKKLGAADLAPDLN